MTFLVIGTYTEKMPHVAGKGAGIYTVRFDAVAGQLIPEYVTAGVTNPSYLAYHAPKKLLVAVQETDQLATSSLIAYRVDRAGGKLHLLGQQPTLGVSPCHVSVDHTGQFVFVANYGSGNVTVFPMTPDGCPQPASGASQHPGTHPHAHMIVPDPTNRFVLAVDLGLDKLRVYQMPSTDGKMTVYSEAAVAAGSGPRHLVFHPNGRVLFLVHEITSMITTWAFADGRFTHLHTVSTLPEHFVGDNAPAAIRVSADGRFVYAANRGHDSVAVFAFDAPSGELVPLAHHFVAGQTPRDFVLDPTGRFMLVANQGSDTVVVFRLNPQTGLPAEKVYTLQIPTPVCLLFVS